MTTSRPFISLVVNNFNYDQFLSECVESCVSQVADVAYEVIVVDDGSSDRSRDILRSRSCDVQFVQKENGGQASAFREGLLHSSGDLVWFVDSDDRLRPGAVQSVYEQWIPGSSVLQGKLHMVDDSGRFLAELHSNDLLEGGDVWARILTRHNHSFVYSPTSALIYAREALLGSMPYIDDALWRTSADGVLVHLAAAFGPVSLVSQVLGDYRVHGNNAWADVQFSPRRSQDPRWSERLQLHEFLRHCATIQFIANERDTYWDFSFVPNMWQRVCDLWKGFPDGFWTRSRVSIEDAEELLQRTVDALRAPLARRSISLSTKVLRQGRSRHSAIVSSDRRARLETLVVEVTESLRDMAPPEHELLTRYPVWDTTRSLGTRRTLDLSTSSLGIRGFSRHAWNPVRATAYNLSDLTQLRIRNTFSRSSALLLHVAANLENGSFLRVEVSLNGQQRLTFDFESISSCYVPVVNSEFITLDMKLSVCESGNWRRAAPQEFYLIAYSVLPLGDSGSADLPLSEKHQVARFDVAAVASAWAHRVLAAGGIACVIPAGLAFIGSSLPMAIRADTPMRNARVEIDYVVLTEGRVIRATAEQDLPTFVGEVNVAVSIPFVEWENDRSVGVVLEARLVGIEVLLANTSPNLLDESFTNVPVNWLGSISEWPMCHWGESTPLVVALAQAMLPRRLVREWLWRADLQHEFDIGSSSGRRKLLDWYWVTGYAEKQGVNFFPGVVEASLGRELLRQLNRAFDQFDQSKPHPEAIKSVVNWALDSAVDLGDQMQWERLRNALVWAARSDLQLAFPSGASDWGSRLDDWWRNWGRFEAGEASASVGELRSGCPEARASRGLRLRLLRALSSGWRGSRSAADG